jgi:uncharacterized membrane protein
MRARLFGRMLLISAVVIASALLGPSMTVNAADPSDHEDSRRCSGSAESAINVRCEGAGTSCPMTVAENNHGECDIQVVLTNNEGKCLIPGGVYKTSCGCHSLKRAVFRECR